MPSRRFLNLAVALLLSILTITLAGVVLASPRAAPLPDSTPPPDLRIEPAVRRIGGIRPPAPAADAAFSSPTTQYSDSGTSWPASGKLAETYYYRVKVTNIWGDSGWSNIQPASVLPPDTFYSIADADVLQGYPNSNTGSDTEMWAGYDDSLDPDGMIVRSHVRFDVSAIPSGTIINSAVLQVYLVNSYDFPNTTRTITTYRISSSWAESSVTWNTRPSFAEAYGSAPVTHGALGWYSFDVTNLVQGWVNDTLPNYGIMLRGPEVSGPDSSWKGFSTREGSNSPQLVITKTVPTLNLVPQKTVDRAQVEAGETLTYTISVLNNGTANAPGARLTDTLPISMSLLGGSLTANSGSAGASGQVITWAGAIAISQTVRITYSVALTNNIPDGTTLVNPVVVDDGAGMLYNTQASVLIGGGFTYLPVILRNFCGGVTIADPGFALQPDMTQINADDAWRQCVLGDPGIVVAIIDSGVDLDHPDLAANLIPGFDYIDNDAVPEDGNGHGTNVAGITGAALNGVGVIGVAPNTHLLPVRVLDDSGQGTLSQVASGITFAADRAHILNLSLGTIFPNATLQSAIAYAINTRGRLVVAAAGNCGDPATFPLNGCNFVDQPNYPAAYSSNFPNVMAVAAVSASDLQASFSNEGAYVTIAAPGVSIYNTYTSPQYKSVSGTSQATPHVAGLAALIWARNPAYNATQVRTAIDTTAVDLGSPGRDEQYGWGRIDVVPAVGLSSVAPAAAQADSTRAELLPPLDNREAEFVPGRVLIKFRPGAGAASIDRTLSAFDGVSLEGQIGQLGIYMLRVPIGQEWRLIDQLRALPDVEFAEPDTIIRLHPDRSSP